MSEEERHKARRWLILHNRGHFPESENLPIWKLVQLLADYFVSRAESAPQAQTELAAAQAEVDYYKSGGSMSKCTRNGVTYKRHKWGREKATTDDITIYGLAINEVPVCVHCGQIWGEQGAFCVPENTDNIDTCLVCGKEVPPGPDFCGKKCEERGLNVQRDQESEDEDGSGEQLGSLVCGVSDGGGSVPVSAGDSGEGDDPERGPRAEIEEEVK